MPVGADHPVAVAQAVGGQPTQIAIAESGGRLVDVAVVGEQQRVIISAFMLSACMIYGRKISQKMDSVVMTGYQLSIGGAALVVAGYACGGQLGEFGWKASALMGYMAILSSAAFAVWAVLLKYNRVGLVAIFNFLIPIFGTVLSAIFLGENIFEWKNVIALALVCSGIWLVTRAVR